MKISEVKTAVQNAAEAESITLPTALVTKLVNATTEGAKVIEIAASGQQANLLSLALAVGALDLT